MTANSAGYAGELPEARPDTQRLPQIPGRSRVIPSQPPNDPQIVQGVGPAKPVAKVTGDAQHLLDAGGMARWLGSCGRLSFPRGLVLFSGTGPGPRGGSRAGPARLALPDARAG